MSFFAAGYDVDWADDVKMPCTFTSVLRGSVGALTLSGQHLKSIFDASDSEYSIVEIGDTELTIAQKASFAGSFGVNTYMKLEPYTPATSSMSPAWREVAS